jgi:hypothetical protein
MDTASSGVEQISEECLDSFHTLFTLDTLIKC